MNEILHNISQAISELKNGKILNTETPKTNLEQQVIINITEDSNNLPTIRQKSLISEGMAIVGDVHLIDSDLEVLGKIKGNIDCNSGNVYILNSCVGDTTAQCIFLSRNATVVGDLEARELVQIGEGCTLKGNIKALGSVSVKGTLIGSVVTQGDIYMGSNSLIRGDITSATIEAAKGARVDGAIKQYRIDENKDKIDNSKNTKKFSSSVNDKA